jgi:hypothetical protein
MDLNDEQSGNQKLAKAIAIIWTILYCFTFPFLLMKALSSQSMLTDPTVTYTQGLIIICMDYAAALVIPLGLYLMWNNYKKGKYERCHFFGAMPFIFFIVYIFLRIEFLDLFLQKAANAATA